MIPIDTSDRYLIGVELVNSARLISKLYVTYAKREGVSESEWSILSALHMNGGAENRGLKQVELAEILQIQPITLTRMLKQLEKNGMVERRRDPEDRRAWRIHLTPKSEPVLVRLRDIRRKIRSAMLEGLNEADVDQLVRLIPRLKGNLEAFVLAEKARKDRRRRNH